jgi:hypothetical protein
MVERICPTCQHGNPLENRFCGACGVALERDAIVPHRADAIVIAGQTIPLAQVRQVGRAVAIGLAAVAVEAGSAWLRRRTAQADLPGNALAVVPRPTAEIAPAAGTAVANVVTIVSQRVIEVWDEGNLTRQIVEKHVWRKEG